MTPESDAGTWLTKSELARVRRISVASATRLIRRQGWRRQPGNDGRVRVLVPEDWMHPRHDDPRDDDTTDPRDQLSDPMDRVDNPRDNNNLLASALAALETSLTSLTARAEAAEQGRELERALAEDLRLQITVLKVEMDEMRTGFEAQLAAARTALQGADALRAADDARKAMGRWGRAWAGWRGG